VPCVPGWQPLHCCLSARRLRRPNGPLVDFGAMLFR
jgi:hypothetical protein